MSGVTAEIAADFIVEAQEILDRLGEQLVALEHAPDDRDQLNAVFRGFHTLKGGAGFLGITPMVELCHAAEETLGSVRAGQALPVQVLNNLRSVELVGEATENLARPADVEQGPRVEQRQRLVVQTQPPEPDHRFPQGGAPVVIRMGRGLGQTASREREQLLPQRNGDHRRP